MANREGKSHRFPPCWDDDERMSYLFSDFRQNRTVNPKDWDNKLQFWSQLVENCCRKDRCAVMECDRMVEGFRRKGRLPMGIQRVLREMANNGQIVPTDVFVNSVSSTWVSWGVQTFVRRPLTWAISSLFKSSDQELTGSYVVVDVLKEISESILDVHRNTDDMDNIVEYTILREVCRDICSDEATLDLALLSLQKMKKVHVETVADGSKVVKFVSKTQHTVGPLTETELGIVSLKRTMSSLKKQIGQHEKEMTDLRTEAVLTVRKGLKTSAKKILRKKKLLERTLERKETTLDTLQQLLDKIQGAETDIVTLEAYRVGASALKQTLKSNGLTPEAVDDTMSEVQEVMELCAEIDDTMSAGNKAIDESVSFSCGINTDMLEAELADLLDETAQDENPPAMQSAETSKLNETDFLAGFPTVPATDPQQSLEVTDTAAEKLLVS